MGSIPLASLKTVSSQAMLEAFRLNTVAPMLALKVLAPALAASAAHNSGLPGSALFFSSIAASTGFPMHTAIAAAKGGLEAAMRTAAAELAPKVRVNCIAPSLTATPLASRLTSSEAMVKALGEAHPMGRLGTPEDGAALAEFLLDSSKSGWITGQVLGLDGGRSTVRHKNQ